MKKQLTSKTGIGLSLFIFLVLLAFSGQHPDSGSAGYTGAPGDQICTACHSQNGSLTGTISITGLPPTVSPNTSYPLTVSINNTSANTANRAGFQLVSLKANLANGGDFTIPASETNVSRKVLGPSNKVYVGHNPARAYSGSDVVTYNVEWISPATATGALTIYGGAIIANGANGNNGDKFVATSVSTTLMAANDPVMVQIVNEQPTTCSDTNDGSATASATGGTGPYNYVWDNGETTAAANALSAGNHTVTVTDSNMESSTASINISSPAPIAIAVLNQSDVSCNGLNDGSVQLDAFGGSGGYIYTWSNGANGPTQTNLSPGTYNITVSDVNMCQETVALTVTEPSPIVLAIDQTDSPCADGTDGSITIVATGGIQPYMYQWSTTDGTAAAGTLSNVGAGSYTLEVTDQNGCVNMITIQLDESAPIAISAVEENPSCAGESTGSIVLTPDNSQDMYSYLWNNGSSSSQQTDLSAGDYAVTVTDSNGCSSEFSYTLADVDPIIIDLNTSTVSCFGGSDGQIVVQATGGNGSFTYAWSSGETTPNIEQIAGTYSVTITDIQGCTVEAEAVLTEPISIESNLTSTDVTFNGANDGTATAAPSNGVAPYSYLWSTGASSAMIEGLAPGNYSVTITDAAGCDITDNIIINNGDCDIDGVATSMDLLCAGNSDGSITLQLSNFTEPATYLWNNGAETATLENLDAGEYSVTITDANACILEITNILISEPDPIVIDAPIIIDASSEEAADGSILTEFFGGTGVLTVEYTDENGDVIDGLTSLENIMAGEYGFTITDENGCMMSFGPFTVGVIVSTIDIRIQSNIYPNPAQDFLTIETNVEMLSNPMLYGLDGAKFMNGQLVSEKKASVDLTAIPVGIYLVKIETTAGYKIQRVVKR